MRFGIFDATELAVDMGGTGPQFGPEMPPFIEQLSAGIGYSSGAFYRGDASAAPSGLAKKPVRRKRMVWEMAVRFFMMNGWAVWMTT